MAADFGTSDGASQPPPTAEPPTAEPPTPTAQLFTVLSSPSPLRLLARLALYAFSLTVVAQDRNLQSGPDLLLVPQLKDPPFLRLGKPIHHASFISRQRGSA